MVKLVTVGSSAAVQCCCCDVVSRSEQEKQSCYELKKREGVDVAWLLDVTDAENTSTAAHG
jgi:energy-converting hydrogenase A subunit M